MTEVIVSHMRYLRGLVREYDTKEVSEWGNRRGSDMRGGI